MIFNTRWTRELDAPESNKGKRMTDPTGYIPLRKRISNMMQSGLTLDDIRNVQYRYTGEELDPTQRPGFDPADYSTIASRTSARLAAQAEAQAAAAKQAEDEADAARIAALVADALKDMPDALNTLEIKS